MKSKLNDNEKEMSTIVERVIKKTSESKEANYFKKDKEKEDD